MNTVLLRNSRKTLGNKGISLVEVIVVVAVITIIAFMAGPELLNIGPKAKMKTAARELKANLELARMEAAKRNRTVEVAFTAGSCSGSYSSTGSYTITIEGKTKSYHPEPGAALCAKEFLAGEDKTLRFNGRGFMVKKDGTIDTGGEAGEDGKTDKEIVISSRYKNSEGEHPAYTITVNAAGITINPPKG